MENSTEKKELESAVEDGDAVENPPAEENVTADNKGVEVKYGDKVLTKSERRKRTALRWTLMNVGIFMMTLSVFFFQTPNNFTLGGVAGIAIIISGFVAPYVPFFTPAVVIAIINVLLIILGLIVLGKQCTVRTIYCSLMYTVEIWAMEQLIGPDKPIPLNMPLTNQPFLELCYAILLFGIGGALIFNCGASSGGTDIIALILKKFTKLNVGIALMIIDLCVVACSVVAFKSPDIFLYSLLGLFAKSFLLDGVIESLGKTKYITIITKHQELISPYILKVINHGYTMYDAEGGYTGEKKKVLITVCKRGEALRLKVKLKQIDPEAFIIITDANEILGKGFGGTI